MTNEQDREQDREQAHHLMPDQMLSLYLVQLDVSYGNRIFGNLYLIYARDLHHAYEQTTELVEAQQLQVVAMQVSLCQNGFTVMHRFYPPVRAMEDRHDLENSQD